MNGHIWRVLAVGEVKCKGDEFYDVHLGWRAIESANGQIGGVIGNNHFPHRRLVPLWPAPRDARIEMPPIGHDVIGLCNGTYWARCNPRSEGLTFWYPLPPVPPSEAESAWRAFRITSDSPTVEGSFIAGFNAGKGAK